MNKKIKALNVDLYPEMIKFHNTPAVDPQKASDLIYQNYQKFFKIDKLEFDLRNEVEWWFLNFSKTKRKLSNSTFLTCILRGTTIAS